MATVAGVYHDFEWDLSFTESGVVERQYQEFLVEGEGRELGVEPVKLIELMTHHVKLASDLYYKAFPNREMTYHDARHVEATAWVAMKMFLGKLLAYRETGGGRALGGQNLVKTLELAAAVFAGHEKDDWWKDKMDATEFYEALAKRGIVRADFDELLKLDEFTKLPDQTTREFEQRGGEQIYLQFLPLEMRMPVVQMMAEAVVAADFAQVCNGEYGREVEVEEGGKVRKMWQGLATLMNEFVERDPKVLVGAGWAMPKPEGVSDADWVPEPDLDKVVWSKDFFENMALPRIMGGMAGLWRFNRKEARNLFVRLIELGRAAK